MAAHTAAQEAGHDEVMPGHLVLGLLSEPEGLAAKAMIAARVTLDDIRGRDRRGVAAATASPDGLVPYSDDSKKVLELTFREALRLGHNYIGTEHILLAQLELEPPAGALVAVGLDKSNVEDSLMALFAQLR